MKLSTLLMIIIALQFSMMMFDQAAQQDTALFGFINNPTGWSSTVLLGSIFGLIGGIVLVGAFVGSLIFGKTDLMVFASTVGTLITLAAPVTSLWQLIYAEKGLFGCGAGPEFCAASAYTASIASGGLMILAIFTIVNWWRGNSEM